MTKEILIINKYEKVRGLQVQQKVGKVGKNLGRHGKGGRCMLGGHGDLGAWHAYGLYARA